MELTRWKTGTELHSPLLADAALSFALITVLTVFTILTGLAGRVADAGRV
jgi:hypothetical protein